MDNHAHILIHTKEQERMIKMMSQCNTSYGLFFSKERGNIGHVFRDRYKTEAIFSRSHLLNCIRYIHQNPVKANIAKESKDYPYSSYNEFVNNKEILDFCDITMDEYIDVPENICTDIGFLGDEDDREDANSVFDEIKMKYDMNNLIKKDVLEIYMELKNRCKISKTQVSKLLNIERRKFAKMTKGDAH